MQLIRKIYNKHIRLGFTCFSILGIWFDWICVVCGVVTHTNCHTNRPRPANQWDISVFTSILWLRAFWRDLLKTRALSFLFHFRHRHRQTDFFVCLLRTLRVWPKSWRIILSKANSFIRRHTSCLMKFWDKTIDRSDTRSHAAHKRVREVTWSMAFGCDRRPPDLPMAKWTDNLRWVLRFDRPIRYTIPTNIDLD